jgi:hypothetical protein
LFEGEGQVVVMCWAAVVDEGRNSCSIYHSQVLPLVSTWS